MSTHRFRRIDRHTAEQLLRGAPAAGLPAAPDALGDLLKAASGPAREGELAGQHAALAAFRSAHLAPDPEQRRHSMIKTMLAGLLTAKILIPAAAAATVGGIALAGVTGTLPLPEDTPANPPADTSTSAPPSRTTPAAKDGAPSPAISGLCQAYTSGADNERGKALDSPAFQALITEAGGKDNVGEYCADVLAERPGKPTDVPSPQSTTPAHPTARPTGTPDEAPARPTGSPTTKPNAPTKTPEHPPGGPDSKPTPSRDEN